MKNGLKCPQCGAWTMILETRTRNDNTRRRAVECANLHRFSTVERVEETTRGGARTKGQEQNT